MNMQTPLLFLSDSPDLNTGLARIGRDLASFLVRSPEHRVGYMGLGGTSSRTLPFPQYIVQRLTGEWGQGVIQRAWSDFSPNDSGIVFTIWDLTRLFWFACPGYMREADPGLAEFLSSGHFQKWGYIPVDSTGPHDRLTSLAKEALLGFDRLLAYTSWGEKVIRRTIGDAEADRRRLTWLPHGINQNTFQPRSKSKGRRMMKAHDNDFVLGIVGTNQARKDWGLMFAVLSALRQTQKRLRVWIHTDLAERYWSIPALASDYGVGDLITLTHSMTDESLSYYYSACDLTLHPGLGEGFGYPAIESLACGVPVIHGNYAGGADVLTQCGWGGNLVEPASYRLDTLHNCLRPVFEPIAWVEKIHQVNQWKHSQDDCRSSTAHLWWENLWPSCWQKFFEEM